MTTTFKQFFLSYFPCGKACLTDETNFLQTAPRVQQEQIIERGNFSVTSIGILTDRSTKSVLQTFDRFQYYHHYAWKPNLIDMEKIEMESLRSHKIFDQFTASIWKSEIAKLHQETQVFLNDFLNFPKQFKQLSNASQAQLTKGGAYNAMIEKYKQIVTFHSI